MSFESDHVRRNRDAGTAGPRTMRQGRAAWAPAGAHVGHLGRARVLARRSAPSRRPRHHRARVRDGLRVGVARPSRRPAGRASTTLAAQLATARAFQREFGLVFPLSSGTPRSVPSPASFDLAISEYGACLWADPYRWVPEAARLLRPGGELIFLTNSVLLALCLPDGATPPADRATSCATPSACTARPGPTAPRSSSTCPTATGCACCATHGFEVEDLIEVRPAADATSRYSFVNARVGAALAVRGDLEGPAAGLSRRRAECSLVFLRILDRSDRSRSASSAAAAAGGPPSSRCAPRSAGSLATLFSSRDRSPGRRARARRPSSDRPGSPAARCTSSAPRARAPTDGWPASPR